MQGSTASTSMPYKEPSSIAATFAQRAQALPSSESGSACISLDVTLFSTCSQLNFATVVDDYDVDYSVGPVRFRDDT